MYEYRKQNNELYRFDQEAHEADFWNEERKTWEPCPEKYDDLYLGFYYEADDSHWIQTYRVISQDIAEKMMVGES